MAGLYNKKGEIDPENYGIAMQLYKELANFECALSKSAFSHVGQMYEKGKGVTKDCNLAIEWYEKGSDFMSLMFLHNKYGCKPDKQLEEKWKEQLCKADPDSDYCK